MITRWGSYTTYSIACWIVWAAIFAYGLITGQHHPGHTPLYVFFGWGLGWLSATIARAVYPPPRPRRP